MFKKVLGIEFKDSYQPKLNLEPLDLIGGDKVGQKLLKFSRPDLVTGWAADLSAVTKKSQSQILEEVILQQFMPRNRTLQAFVDTLYSENGTVNENVSETARSVLSLRTGGNFKNADADFKPLAEMIDNRIVGRHIWYDGRDYAGRATSPMFHLMSYFTSCRDYLFAIIERALDDCGAHDETEPFGGVEYPADYFQTQIIEKNNPEEAKDYAEYLIKDIRNEFDYLIDLWALEEGGESFSEPIHNFVAPVLKFWDNGLCEFRGAYTVLYDAVGFALYDTPKEIFDIKDRLQILDFINYLDQTEAIKEYNFD